ncbi:MAG: glycoside hydrolase [Actinomycetota bacterium]|nr:glycoside hydrolase [Actinomycetota bacterium]
MRYVAFVAVIVGMLALALVDRGSPASSVQTDPFSSGYMRHLQSGSLETLVAGSAPPNGESVGRNRWMFDPGPPRDTETSLAVDPRDPDRVLVAWQEDISLVWTARTEDGGRRWTVEALRDPDTRSVAFDQEGFDPTAAIGPDGTMYVLMGVTEIPGGLTLVRLDKEGWSFHRVDAVGDVHAWDAMHLAVAPDTGELYAVAQSIDHRGIGFWQSSDRGDSWSVVRFPQVETPQGAAQVAQDGINYWPRIAAGPDGLVLIVTKAILNGGSDIRTTVSSDGGETFGPLAPLTDEPLSGRLVGVPPAFDGARAFVGFVTDDIVLAEAKKAVGPWQLRRFPRSDRKWDPDWSTVTARNGTVWILHTEQNSRPSWRALLTRIRGESIKTTTLASTTTQQPRGTRPGDEYGGLGVGKDGCVWASWAHPSRSGAPVIMVTKQC